MAESLAWGVPFDPVGAAGGLAGTWAAAGAVGAEFPGSWSSVNIDHPSKTPMPMAPTSGTAACATAVQGRRSTLPFRRTRKADREWLGKWIGAGRLRVASGGSEGLSGSTARAGTWPPAANRSGRAAPASVAPGSVRRAGFTGCDGDKRIVIRGLSIVRPSHPVPLLRCVCNRMGR
ncbi:hypothetical protein [Calditerricola satsumensis]|uniref:Uncharacterized protein n=1 Tax=Calditerricola satsumensis TaxID=373054 RepID=A0A8J3FC17_9BACI|nr:hypothetical protein [Calditerricola satsumensis]GGK03982.1 hypothetical protein GCM10007043_17580 [Calditerricola satsumensis]